jgi:hypothetical protein
VFLIVAARPFWVNQLSMLIGSGEDGGAIEAGVGDRLMGDTGQVVVKMLRIIVPGLTWLLAIAGAWVYWRRRRDLVPIALAVVPMGVILQGYGGEVFMRVVLYGLPVLTILCTDALRAMVRRKRSREIALAVGMAILFVSTVLIRGGNDAYQTVFPEQVELARKVIAETPPGQEIVPLSHLGPYGVEGIGVHSGGEVVEGCSQLANDPMRCIDAISPDVIITFTAVENEGVVLDRKEPGWSLRLIDELVASGRYVLTYQEGFNAVLKKAAPGPLEGG